MVKRGNDNAQMSKEEYEAQQGRVFTVAPDSGFQRATPDEIAKRCIVKARKPPPRVFPAEEQEKVNLFARAGMNMSAVIPSSAPMSFSFSSGPTVKTAPVSAAPAAPVKDPPAKYETQALALETAFKGEVLSRMSEKESVVSWEKGLCDKYVAHMGAQCMQYHDENPTTEEESKTPAAGNAVAAPAPAPSVPTYSFGVVPSAAVPPPAVAMADNNEVVPANDNATDVVLEQDDGWEDHKVLEPVAFWCLETVKGEEKQTFVKRALGKLRLQKSTTSANQFRMLMRNEAGIKVLVNSLVTGDMKVEYLDIDTTKKWLQLGWLCDGVMGEHMVRAKAAVDVTKQLHDELVVLKAKA